MNPPIPRSVHSHQPTWAFVVLRGIHCATAVAIIAILIIFGD